MNSTLTGLTVPDFSAPSTGGNTFRLSAASGQSLVLYFYPRDNTPGCTDEGRQFNELHDLFRGLSCEIYGVSRDSLRSHEKFKEKQSFPFELLSDPDEKLCRQFDVIKEKMLYGRKFMGVERSTFLIDEEGKLREEWRKVKVKGHAAAVLDSVKNC